MPTDDQQSTEPRQKRAKIVSACSECRRKKTKCNGEQPCRNCQKSSVPCVYPTSHSDDKRNGPSKAALEAIEERLKAIEDMLKTIVQSQLSMGDLDPAAVNKFLNKDPTKPNSPPPQGGSTPTSSSGTSYRHLYISPSPQPSPSLTNSNAQNNNNNNTVPSPTMNQSHRPSPPTSTSSTSSSHELRLPSIHSLSAPSAEQRDLPPLGHIQDYYYSSSTASTPPQPSDVDNQLDRKRKRQTKQ
ncbi:uncharacterized protein BX664DRAFT_342359 [Halteromyces radiatus]|uniref:uncharacterized protein n=1 Tax=Halteromyces radiatus TaxID=101107 RepID=UPI00221EA527|nr:uncharacterized protein BX664DRAFT_342359 [Halteromyces radiatus]KAI8078640.1 hypothetical protein BX664DRAFT_342359 [Halteromyces radiatus]